MKPATAIVLLFTVFSCQDRQKEQIKMELAERQPDKVVLRRLHLYDSLRTMIITHLPLFFNSATLASEVKRWNGSLVRFVNHEGKLQMIHHDGNETMQLPDTLQMKALVLMGKIGAENIVGFEIRPDSTFEVLIRNEYVKRYHLDVRERMIWTSRTVPVVHSEFMKASAVTNNWAYHIWYDKRAGW